MGNLQRLVSNHFYYLSAGKYHHIFMWFSPRTHRLNPGPAKRDDSRGGWDPDAKDAFTVQLNVFAGAIMKFLKIYTAWGALKLYSLWPCVLSSTQVIALHVVASDNVVFCDVAVIVGLFLTLCPLRWVQTTVQLQFMGSSCHSSELRRSRLWPSLSRRRL